MKRLVNYIKNLFGAYRNHRTRGCGWVVGDASLSGSACHIITPEQFRELFEKAYPIAAEFLSAIEKYDMEDNPVELPIFFFKGSFLAHGAVSSNAVAPQSKQFYSDSNISSKGIPKGN